MKRLIRSLIELWRKAREYQGMTLKDRFSVLAGQFTYLSIKVLLLLFLGKDKGNFYILNRRLTFARFLPYDARVRYQGLCVLIPAGGDGPDLLSCYHEPNLTSFIEERLNEEDVFMNIGSNYGKYILLAGKRIKRGRIIAVEAYDKSYAVLVENLKLNNVQAECINAAVSDSDGLTRLYLSTRSSDNSLIFYSDKTKYVQVKTITLDSLAKQLNLNMIDWLLIDVEGSEDRVLKGGIDALSITKNIVVEIHSEQALYTINNFLIRNNFNTTFIDEHNPSYYLVGTKSEQT